MNSATSTSHDESVRLKPDATGDALRPWQLFTLAGLIGATVVVFMSRGHTPSGIILLSLIVFAAAVVGIGAWRMLGPLVTPGDASLSPVLGGRTRAGLEREKALALRAIKELEFDRAMGKVSEKDFAEMGGRLRMRAAGLMRQLDAGTSYREQISQEIEKRVGAVSKADALLHACTHCGTENDGDAQFCKRCGASLETSE